jgi:formamidopyrimidine-DNA glycosylase
MPELPEVETIRKGLETYLIGKTIDDINVRLLKMVSGEVDSVIGASIIGVRRFGKGLVIDLSNKFSLAIHIKMTGQLIYEGIDVPQGTTISQKVGGKLPNKYTHVVVKLKTKNEKRKRDAVLYYNDIRQFGWMKIVRTRDVSSLPFFKTLGPEPLNTLKLKQFNTILKKARTSVKVVLMDQKRIAGVGNIYANDALFLAKIHPKRTASSLDGAERERLFRAVEAVLRKGIEAGGASEWQYVNALGVAGKYQNFFQVYGRKGKPCVVCKTPIQKITIGGRGTFFCPVCQT